MSINKLALHFGAGNIGRGFICPELKKSNYDVVFVDVDEDLINEINLKKEYKVTSLDINSESSEVIGDVSGISINDIESINSYLSKADVISTSVGPKYVQGIYELIDNANTSKEIFFIAFENQYRSSTKVQQKNSKNSSGIVKISNLAPKSFLSNAFSNYKKNKELNKIKAIKLEKLKEKNQILKERKDLKVWEERLIKESNKLKFSKFSIFSFIDI